MPNLETSPLQPTLVIPLGDFPTDCLPDPVRAFIRHTALSIGVPVEMIALPVLVDVSAAIGNRRHIELKEGWTEAGSIYAALIAPPGGLKSPALKAGLLSPNFPNNSGPNRRWTSDVTVEKAAVLLDKHPEGILIFRDELSGWVASMNQYKGGRGSDRQFYLSVWGGSRYAVDRKDGTQIDLLSPFVSVVGGIQPELIGELEDAQGRDDGFLARFLFAWPDPFEVRWTYYEMPGEVKSQYELFLQALFNFPSTNMPVVIPLTAAASYLFVQWHDVHCIEGEGDHLSVFMQSVYAKLKGYCGRLALIHAICRDPNTEVVEVESIAAAAGLIDFFKTQALKVDAALSKGNSSPVERCKTAIERKLLRRPCMKRDLQRSMSHDAATFNEAFDELRKPKIIITKTSHGEEVSLNRQTDTKN